jgi:hypothetical protein
MTRRQNRTFVAMPLPARTPDLIGVARAILAASKKSTFLPAPRPPLATLAAAIDALDQAETAATTHTRGTAEVRNEAESALRATLRTFKSYVQEQADANPEQAGSIIASAGMNVRRASSRAKAPFTGKPGKISGTVALEVKAAGKRATYDWQWRVQGTAKWNRAPKTLQAKTTISGLPIGQYVDFRYRVVTKTGEGDWSEPITVLVN